MKIKYASGITKCISQQLARKNREAFLKKFDEVFECNNQKKSNREIELSVVSYSSKKDFPEQLLSILSFLNYAGKPISWTIYSDGTHTAEHRDFFKNCMPFITIAPDNPAFRIKDSLEKYRNDLLNYANSPYPLGKKLLYYLNHKVCGSTIFIDSDVLFYCKADHLHTILNEKYTGWFLPEWQWGTIDAKYADNTVQQLYQVNSGFFLLNREIEPEMGLSHLRSLNNDYEYFTEQTVFHIIFKENGLMPLDPRIFILNNCDQFNFSYNFKREDIALRHYTGPVRHKMWQRNWKWHLMLS